jgi:hypothetical protein
MSTPPSTITRRLFASTISMRPDDAGTAGRTSGRGQADLTNLVIEFGGQVLVLAYGEARRRDQKELIELGLDRSAVKKRQPKKPRQQRSN